MNEIPAGKLLFYLCGTDEWRQSGEGVHTHFAPPGRSSPEEFCHERSRVLSVLGLQSAIDAMPGCVAILNGHRQIVLAKRILKSILTIGKNSACRACDRHR